MAGTMPRRRQGPPPPLCAGLDGSHPAAARCTRCCGPAGPGAVGAGRERGALLVRGGSWGGGCPVAGCGGVQPPPPLAARSPQGTRFPWQWKRPRLPPSRRLCPATRHCRHPDCPAAQLATSPFPLCLLRLLLCLLPAPPPRSPVSSGNWSQMTDFRCVCRK